MPLLRQILASTGFLTASLILITVLSSVLFVRLESTPELLLRVNAAKAKQKVFQTAQKLATEGEDADWHALVDQVKVYKERLQEAWSAGTDELATDTPPKWTYAGALYFCTTIFTTIGYGNMSPVTTQGKVLSIAYGLVSMTLFALILQRLSIVITRFIKAVGIMTQESKFIPTGLGSAYQRSDGEFNLSFGACVGLLVLYLLIGAGLYSWWLEGTSGKWSPLESVYFAFVSLSTIGFGDLVPEVDAFFSVFSVTYVVVGLALCMLVLGRFHSLLSETLESLANPVDPNAEANERPSSRFATKTKAKAN